MPKYVTARLHSRAFLWQFGRLVSTSKRRLMIVDDHAETRRLICDLLGSLAAAVCECTSGEEAVQRCEEFKPDFVTMDLKLRALNGLEATREILARLTTEIVIVTDSDTVELRRAALRAGAAGCFSKNNLTPLLRHFETSSG